MEALADPTTLFVVTLSVAGVGLFARVVYLSKMSHDQQHPPKPESEVDKILKL